MKNFIIEITKYIIRRAKMIKIPEDHIQQYLKIFGTGLDQIDILQEECAELIKALGNIKDL